LTSADGRRTHASSGSVGAAVPAPGAQRDAVLERLGRIRFDLLVIGGGILGAGIAALAAEHGLSVALVDRSDFASGTSSASSKLIHGGLRYLRMGDFRLVREAHLESRALRATVAPHLVRHLRFLLPIYEEGPYRRGTIRSALWLYQALAGDEARNGLLPNDLAAALVPSLQSEHLRSAGVYMDAQTNDARLCLATLTAAAGRGATLLNYAEVIALDWDARGSARAYVEDRLAGGSLQIAARTIVNATGPWVDAVRRLESPQAGTSVTLSKGAHVVIAQPEPWRAALTIPLDRHRVSFAIPWEGVLILGTTDELFEGDPDQVEVTSADERQILEEAGRGLVPEILRADSILARFAGLRVLPAANHGSAANVRRETRISRGQAGMVSVAGGKLTTYRRTALEVMQELRAELQLHRIDAATTPLPGATDPDEQAARLLRERPELTRTTAELLARTYGSLAGDLLARANRDPEALEPLVPGAPELVAQVHHAREHEWAVTADDVLRRRTTLATRGYDSPDVHARVEALLAQPART
jgi:glycerol-3-phosphate dehydrogenase